MLRRNETDGKQYKYRIGETKTCKKGKRVRVHTSPLLRNTRTGSRHIVSYVTALEMDAQCSRGWGSTNNERVDTVEGVAGRMRGGEREREERERERATTGGVESNRRGCRARRESERESESNHGGRRGKIYLVRRVHHDGPLSHQCMFARGHSNVPPARTKKRSQSAADLIYSVSPHGGHVNLLLQGHPPRGEIQVPRWGFSFSAIPHPPGGKTCLSHKHIPVSERCAKVYEQAFREKASGGEDKRAHAWAA